MDERNVANLNEGYHEKIREGNIVPPMEQRRAVLRGYAKS